MFWPTMLAPAPPSGIGHGRAVAPRAGPDIVDLGKVLHHKGCIDTAEDIDRVGVGGIHCSRRKYPSWNVRQGSPGISDWIIEVKPAGIVNPACGIGKCTVARHGRRFVRDGVIGNDGPWREI